jgi:NTE family protein
VRGRNAGWAAVSWWLPRQTRVSETSVDAVVLTGGAARGAVQVGMLRALHEAGIKPAAIAGTSVGSLNGAWFATYPTVAAIDELTDVWLRMHETGVFRATRRDMIAGLLHRPYFVPTEGLHSVIAQLSLTDLSEAQIPMRVLTTRLDTGVAVVHRSGAPAAILAASCAIPGVFQPVPLSDGAWHVDGGVAALAPVFAVQDVTPTRIFLLDSTGPAHTKGTRTAIDMVRTAFSHSIRAQMEVARVLPGVIPISVPDEAYGGRDSRDFSASAELIAAGYAAAREVLASLALPAVDPVRGVQRPWLDLRWSGRRAPGEVAALEGPA